MCSSYRNGWKGLPSLVFLVWLGLIISFLHYFRVNQFIPSVFSGTEYGCTSALGWPCLFTDNSVIMGVWNLSRKSGAHSFVVEWRNSVCSVWSRVNLRSVVVVVPRRVSYWLLSRAYHSSFGPFAFQDADYVIMVSTSTNWVLLRHFAEIVTARPCAQPPHTHTEMPTRHYFFTRTSKILSSFNI